jgi:hypothetical protein
MTVQAQLPPAELVQGGQIEYEGVRCPACQRIHLINIRTGRLQSEDGPG